MAKLSFDKENQACCLFEYVLVVNTYLFLYLGVQKAYVDDARKDTGMREIYRDEVR